MPNLNTVYDQVAFELQELPLGFEEALAACDEKKQLILNSYKRELFTYLYKEQQEKNMDDLISFSQQSFVELYKSRSTLKTGEEAKTEQAASKTTPEEEKTG